MTTKTTHPTYQIMIKSAITTLTSSTKNKGVSKQAIDKQIKSVYTVKETHLRSLTLALKKMLASGVLVKAKGLGVAGSFKLNKATLDADKAKTKKAKAKTVTKKTTPTKKPVKKPAKKPASAAIKKPTKKPTPTKKPKAPATAKKTPIKKPAKKPVPKVTTKKAKSPKKTIKK